MTERTCKRPGCEKKPRPGVDRRGRQPGYCADHDNSASRMAALRARQVPRCPHGSVHCPSCEGATDAPVAKS